MISNRFVFFGNGSYYNRGCEAILRGSIRILRDVFESPSFVDAGFGADFPPHLAPTVDEAVVREPIHRLKKRSLKWLAARVLKRMRPPAYRSLYFGALGPHLKQCGAALAIGGDNYSLDYGVPTRFLDLDTFILAHGVPLVLWGASVGPFDREPAFARKMHAHLRDDVLAIFVREQRSLRYLAEHGVTQNVFPMPDPAFLMEPAAAEDLTLGFDMPAQAIGLNVSPLIARYWTKGDRDAMVCLGIEIVQTLRDRLARPIVLIPHVTSARSNDFALLSEIYGGLDDQADVYCVGQTLNAPQTKAVISQLDCLVAARTHATIAAFAARVPTVSLAYSLKAYGINEQLFGHTDYVVEPDDFSVAKLLSKVDRVLEDNEMIRGQLGAYMQQVRDQAREAGQTLRSLLE